MGQQEDLAKVAGLSLLDAMPGETKQRAAQLFLDVGEHWDLADGEALLHEGYLSFESGYVLIEGSVEIVRSGGSPIVIAAPALLGEMSQFKSGDTRSATVRAKGTATVLQFPWDDLYARMKERLSKEEQRMFMDAMERLVWERFDRLSLMDLDMFSDLNQELKRKVCLVFPWITEVVICKDEQILFEEGGHCGSKGHLLTQGAIRLTTSGGRSKVYEAPNIIGVMPKHEPGLQWTAAATAQGEVEVLIFSWQNYTARMEERLSHDERNALVNSIRAHAREHFWH